MSSRNGKVSLVPIDCAYCGATVAPGDVTRDHLVPRSAGFSLNGENRVLCCFICNNIKGNLLFKSMAEARAWVLAQRQAFGVAPTATSVKDWVQRPVRKARRQRVHGRTPMLATRRRKALPWELVEKAEAK